MEATNILVEKPGGGHRCVLRVSETRSVEDVKTEIGQILNCNPDTFYLSVRDRPLNPPAAVEPNGIPIYIKFRLIGGKGGFGSMLRAIGAQIEKTTNRDACRDLSGRRLRDINEEQKLKKWFDKQGEREQEKIEAKKRKLQKLQQIVDGPPLPKIEDQKYNKQRAEMADSVYDAVDEGFDSALPTISKAASKDTEEASFILASTSAATVVENTSTIVEKPKKMKKLMLDEDFSDDSDASNEEEVATKKIKISA